MQPKKKNVLLPIIYVVGFLFVLYVCIHGAVVWESVARMLEAGNIQKNQQLLTFIAMLSERLETSSGLKFNHYTKEWVLKGSFAWLIVVLAIENSRRNFIHGKEYGTARWGTLADIKGLFASSLEGAEIRNVKRTKTWIGRMLVRNQLRRKCVADGRVILKAQLDNLEVQRELEKLKGTKSKTSYRKRRRELIKKSRKETADAVRTAWKPDKLKADLNTELKEINHSSVYTDEEKENRKKLAKEIYQKKLAEFYDYAKQVRKIKEKYKDADMLFTKTEKISFYNYIVNAHCLVFAGSGGGKTRSHVMPNLLQAHTSFVVTDPKGEVLEKAGHFLSKVKGYKIRVLNLDEKTLSDGYNPFCYIHPERAGYEERVLSLIETIIINTDGGEAAKSPDPFWPKAERLFLQAVFFFTADGFVPEERNMSTVLTLIGMLKIAEEEDDMNSDLDIFARIFEERFGADHIGVQQYKEFRGKASGKTAKSIVISAVARLAPFRTSEIKRIFSYDNMQLDRVGEEKMAVFVVLPPTDKTYNFVAGMLFQQLFQELQYCATQVHKHDGQRLPVPVRFILDEFANTCNIPDFIQILAYARSFGIGITPILQSLEQLKKMYENEWGVVIDNCSSMLYLGNVKHMDTLEYLSKLLGKGTYDKKTRGKSKGSGASSSQNEDVIGRELMTPDEIQRMPKKDCLFFTTGLPAFYSEKYVYEDHPNYRFTSDANKEYSFSYVPLTKEEVLEKTGEKKSVPKKEVHVDVVPIELDSDEKAQINRVAENFSNLVPIPDEEMTVNDGENNEEEMRRKAFAELVGKEEAAKERAKLSVYEETKKYLEGKKEEQIRVEESIMQTVNRLGRTERHLEIIPDEELTVNDGEDVSHVDESFMDFIMDEDDEFTPEELNDVMNAKEDNMSGFLSELKEMATEDFEME